MPLYISEYLADTAHFSTLTHGAYLLLIMNYWQTEKPLPNDDKKLAAITRLSMANFKKINTDLKKMFFTSEGRLVHKRIEKELAIFREKAALARVKAEKRWEGKEKNSYAAAMPQQCRSIAAAMPRQCYTDTDTDTDTDTEDIHSSQILSGKKGNFKTEVLDRVIGAEPKIPENPTLAKRCAEAKRFRSAPVALTPPQEIFIFIPLRGGEEYGMTEEMTREFERSYPDLDVRGKLQKIRTWSISNPTKQKTARGILRFINYWLAGDNDKLSDGLSDKKLSAVEHNQLLLESRQAQRHAESLKQLPARGKDNGAN